MAARTTRTRRPAKVVQPPAPQISNRLVVQLSTKGMSDVEFLMNTLDIQDKTRLTHLAFGALREMLEHQTPKGEKTPKSIRVPSASGDEITRFFLAL